jgi:hypothetical protein
MKLFLRIQGLYTGINDEILFKGENVKNALKTLATLLSGLPLLMLLSCSSTGLGNKQVEAPLVPLSCIAVLPAGTSVEQDQNISYERAQSLEKGARFATSVMTAELRGKPKVMILTSEQVSSAVSEVSGGITGTVAALGRRLNCDAVLLTTVRRFDQRQGTELAAESPAVVNFDMSLRHAESGAVLWSADFKETQESFLSNIFSNNKMRSQGFRWLTAEQLMEQGIKERLASCPYLQQ